MNPLDFLIAPAHAAAAAPAGPSLLSTFMFPILLIAIMYFLLIRPQMKRQKEQKAMIDALAKGDEIVVAGGVIGRISKLGETFLHVEVSDNVEIQGKLVTVIRPVIQ